MLFNNSNNETDVGSGALVFSRRCSLVASIYSQFYTSLKYIVDWTGALCEGLLLVWRRLLEFLGTASILCRVKLSGKYCHFQTFLSCALSSCRVCDVIPLEVLESNFNHKSCPFCPTGFSHLKSVTFHFSETLRCKSFSGVSQCDYSHLEVSDLYSSHTSLEAGEPPRANPEFQQLDLGRRSGRFKNGPRLLIERQIYLLRFSCLRRCNDGKHTHS